MKDDDFARRLMEARQAAGLSQYEVARRAGITRETIRNLEDGGQCPSWLTVQLLALVLGLSTDAFRDSALALPNVPPPRRTRKAENPSAELDKVV